jgi:hypothetical protein
MLRTTAQVFAQYAEDQWIQALQVDIHRLINNPLRNKLRNSVASRRHSHPRSL